MIKDYIPLFSTIVTGGFLLFGFYMQLAFNKRSKWIEEFRTHISKFMVLVGSKSIIENEVAVADLATVAMTIILFLDTEKEKHLELKKKLLEAIQHHFKEDKKLQEHSEKIADILELSEKIIRIENNKLKDPLRFIRYK